MALSAAAMPPGARPSRREEVATTMPGSRRTRPCSTSWSLTETATSIGIANDNPMKPPVRLSLQALETLAVIAYKQPISRGQVAAIRGVDPDAVMRTLQARGYITEVGRDDGLGVPSRPALDVRNCLVQSSDHSCCNI